MNKLTILILFLFPLFCLGQNNKTASISGFVFDASDKKPLPNSTIVLSEKNISCISLSDGSFSFKGLLAGTYLLKVSYVGFQKYEKKIELKSGQNYTFNVFLKDTSITSTPIEVIAFKETNLLEQPQRITIIKASEIQVLPSQSINDIIDYAAGISMSNTSGFFSSKAVVTMRGLPANDQSRTLVILDGVPLNKSDEGSVNWNMINKENVAEIKITKGPGPAKFGSGAMGGVIEIISKKPLKKLQGDLSLSYGTYNTIASKLNLSGVQKKKGKISQIYWGVAGAGRKSDGYITEPDSFYTAEDSILVPVFLKELNTAIKAGCDFNNNQNLEAQIEYFDDERGNGVKVFDYYGAFSKHRTLKSIAKYSGSNGFYKWSSNIFFISENYYRLYEYMKEGEYMLYEANSTRQDKGANVEVSYSKFKNHTITSGFNLKNGSVDGTDTYYTSTDIIRNAAKMDNYALFIQDEVLMLDEKVRINAGLRYDFAKFHDALFTMENPSYSLIFYDEFENTAIPEKSWNALCPRLSAQYLFSEKTRVYVSGAKGFRAPILDDMSRTGKKKGGFKVANPALKPEQIYSYEAGIDFNITKKLKSNVSVFYSIGKDFMYYTSTGDSVNMGYKLSPIFKKQNIGKVEIYGLETEFKYAISDSLSFFVNYSFTHAQIIKHDITDSQVDSNLTGKYLTDIPNHKASAGFVWNNRFFTVSLLGKYVGETWINDWNTVDEEYLKSDKYPDYFIFNIRFEKSFFKHLNTALSVENILNKRYIDSDVQQSPGRFITASVKYYF